MTVKQLLADFGNSALRLATFGRFGTKGLTIYRDNFYPVGAVSQSLTGALSSEGLNSNVVMAPVMWIMRTFTEATAVVESWKADNQTWNYVNDHAVERLVERPNEFYNGDALWKATCVSYVLAGNAYWRKVRNQFGDVIALWYVPHWLIQPKWDAGGTTFITHYEYTTGLGPPDRLPVRDVVHFRFGLDLENPRLGMSPLRPLLREVAVDDNASQFSETILGNMGVPGLVMSPKFEKYSPKQGEIEKLRDYLSNAFSGRNRGKPMVMGVPTEVHQFGFNPNQVELTNVRDIAEERVCAALGLPAAIVGFGSGLQSTKVGATMREMRRLAWVQCLTPMQKSMAKDLTSQLLPDFQTQHRFRVRFDTMDVSAFQEEDDLLAARVARLVEAGMLRVDRAQAMLRLEVDPTQQIYLRPTSAVADGPSAPKIPAPDPDPARVEGAVTDEDGDAESDDTKALRAIAARRALASPNGKH